MHSHPVFGSIIDSGYSEAGNNRHATAPTDSSAAIPIISEERERDKWIMSVLHCTPAPGRRRPRLQKSGNFTEGERGHNEEMNRLEGNERWKRRRGAVLNMAILSNTPTESCGH